MPHHAMRQRAELLGGVHRMIPLGQHLLLKIPPLFTLLLLPVLAWGPLFMLQLLLPPVLLLLGLGPGP